MKRDELGDLSTFMVVAEERSFTRAAAKLGTSQSAVSHTVRRLETRLGLRLLVRTTRNVAPTEAGERLLETLRPAFDDIEQRVAALGDLRDRPAGTIRITCGEHAARRVLWPVLERLLPAYPDIKVEISVDDSLADLVEGRFDAGVRLGERLGKDMIAVPIGPELRMVVIASPDYLARRGTPQTPHDLADHACINYRLPTLGGLYAWEFEKDGQPTNVRVSGQLIFNSMALVQRAALAGMGLAVMMHDEVAPLIAEGRLTTVLDDWTPPFSGYHLYYPSRRQPTPAFALLVDALRYRGR
ncbi:LysR family transcriptional regulator [Brevundimonas goettingensis]|uniref:LysR family transcriptional regulator n=1 Tax=Brevundimonas goettingensis TaxID=2774190 RepID=A0A975GXP7_9CAUL|nr:LysR family transcriptional regulator [Brevundimonas goettingensis]QTC90760.1 LysR family transcriptional regulator [Brevundimonas goettingensis]